MTTDDGFCCVFNAIEQTSLLKTDIIEPVRYGMKHTRLYKYYRIPKIDIHTLNWKSIILHNKFIGVVEHHQGQPVSKQLDVQQLKRIHPA